MSGSDDARSYYIHGTAVDEQQRLARLNALINARCLTELALSPGERVLDLGCGLGLLTHAAASAVGPSGVVLGIEREAEQLRRAAQLAPIAQAAGSVELRKGTAEAPPLLEAEWGTFDVAHARFLLEHVRDPQRVVRGMARAVRPGGRIVLMDDNHAWLAAWPEPPGLSAVWAAYIRSYDRMGNDPFVGRRLVALLHGADCIPRRATLVPFSSCAGSVEFEDQIGNLIGILTGARTAILAAGALAAGAFEETLEQLQIWSRRPDAALWYGIPWACGVRPS